LDSKDVQSAVDTLAAKTGQSVLIEDREQRPLWWSTTGRVDGPRLQTLVHRRVDDLCRRVVREYQLIEATAPVHTPPIPEGDMWARWCMPVRDGSRHLGFLWLLDPDEDIDETQLPLLVECADLAASVLSKNKRAGEHDRRLRNELIHRLCLGEDDHAARELVRLECLPYNARVQVQAPGRPGGWTLPGELSAHIAGSRPRAATSGAPLPLVELGRAINRAVAVRRVLAAGGQLEAATWDDLGAWRLIVDAPDTLAVADVHPGADILARRSKADLLTTARAVLDRGGDVTAAAEALHVHRTTLYYRLAKIMDCIGIDLRDGKSRTDLQLALWLAAYRAVGIDEFSTIVGTGGASSGSVLMP
jgi:hypothetical protein